MKSETINHNGTNYKIKVSDCDHDLLKYHTWTMIFPGTKKTKVPYARHSVTKHSSIFWGLKPRSIVYLHRVILARKLGIALSDLKSSVHSDHRDGNSLDNTRSNIRKSNYSGNTQNRKCGWGISGVRGVHWSKRDQRWRVELNINGNALYFGSYISLPAAISVAHYQVQKVFGRWSRR
jgi:hypothetical protein